MFSWAFTFYSWIVAFGKMLRSPLLLILRLFFGLAWFFIGIGKWKSINPFVEDLQSLHFFAPKLMAYFVASLELVGGLFLAIGLLSRLISIPLAITMIVAYSTAHIESVRAIFSNPQLFISQPAFNFLLTTLLILAFGPGIFSLDYLIKKRVNKWKN